MYHRATNIFKNFGEEIVALIKLITVKRGLMAGMLCILTVIVMVFQYLFLTRYPPVFIDEPWYVDAAKNFLTTGNYRESMHDFSTTIWSYIGNFPLLASIYFMGIDLFHVRLVSWILGIGLLCATFILGRELYGTITGLLAVLLLSISLSFTEASHIVRPDIFLAATVVFGMYLIVVGLKTIRWWVHGIAGLVIGLSFDIHQNAILFLVAAAFMYGVVYGRNIFKQKSVWAFVGGSFVGVLYYVVVHFVYANPLDLNQVYQLTIARSHQPPIREFSLFGLLKSIRDEIGRYHFYEYGLDFALLGASIVYLGYRRKAEDKVILSIVLSVFALFVLLIGNKHDVYAILLYPFFTILIAEAFLSLIKNSEIKSSQALFTIILLVLFIFSNLFHLVRPVMENRHYNYYEITEKFRSVIPHDAVVMGMPNWWLGMADYNFRSSLNLTYYRMFDGLELPTAMEKIRPDYIIIDPGFRGLLVDSFDQKSSGFDIYLLPRNEFVKFLDEHGEQLLEFSTPCYGRDLPPDCKSDYFVYAIHWDK